MNTEQKAKAYDEALKVLHKYDGVNIMFSQSLKEEMFPELKKSEEDMIRKLLIEAVIQVLQDQYCSNRGVSKEKVVAWLEKQGEKSVDKLQVSGELYEHIRNTCACIDDALSSETLADINDYLSMAERSAKSAFDMIEKIK